MNDDVAAFLVVLIGVLVVAFLYVAATVGGLAAGVDQVRAELDELKRSGIPTTPPAPDEADWWKEGRKQED
jgi:hypothetical protein